MAKGFFMPMELKTTSTTIPNCGACGLHKQCKNPFMKVIGKGQRKILIIANQPDEVDDRHNRNFSGPYAGELRGRLVKLGIDLREDCWTFTALSCYSSTKPNPNSVEWCRPNVIKVIQELKPKVILLLGNEAVKSVLGWVWKPDCGPVNRWLGYTIPCRKLNAWIICNYHPDELITKSYDVPLSVLFDRYLQPLKNLKERPFDKKEAKRNFENEVEVILDTHAIVNAVKHFMKDRAIAFDYETNMLKPDSSDSRIVSCSISNGVRTIAFPWMGNDVKEQVKILLTNSEYKIASNMKFEDRWTRKHLNCEVNKWHPCGDTMLTAHCLDNGEKPSQKKLGRSISSIKFQAFVHLGVPDWDSHITPFLKGKENSGYSKNKIHEVGLTKLLIYNGLDSLYEYLVWQKQKQFIRSSI